MTDTEREAPAEPKTVAREIDDADLQQVVGGDKSTTTTTTTKGPSLHEISVSKPIDVATP